MDKFMLKYGKFIVGFASAVSMYSANVVCAGYLNQPKVPDAVKKLRKF